MDTNRTRNFLKHVEDNFVQVLQELTRKDAILKKINKIVFLIIKEYEITVKRYKVYHTVLIL